MNKSYWLIMLVVVFLVHGCGSTEEFLASGNSQSGPPSSQHTLSGFVLSEGGDAQSGVRVIAHERTSDIKTQTVSGPDGRYELELLTGVYDVGLDRSEDFSTATCFYGPVTVDGERRTDLVLRGSQGRPASHVSGKLWSTPGVPASNRNVVLRSGHLSDPEASPTVATTTTSDGTFEVLLSSDEELGLDMEVFDSAGNFDEFIDIGKLSKPLYVEFITELPVSVNRLRSNETDKPVSPEVRAQSGTFTLFDTLNSVPDPSGGPNMLILSGGLLPVDDSERTFFDGIMTPAAQLDFNPYRGLVASGPIKVAKNGSWWWTYAVNIQPNRASYWKFEDETADSYSLSVYITSRWHKVSYNSDKPDIQAVATLDPLSPGPGD